MSYRPGHDRNCLSYWFPRLQVAGVPVPETIIVRWDGTAYDYLQYDHLQLLERIQDLIQRVEQAAREIGLPCFLRTGLTSNKWGWKNSCYLTAVEDVADHLFNLCEFSTCADLIGLPCNVFAVREFLPATPRFHAFQGRMPVVAEVRCFVSGGEIVQQIPYWPEDSIRSPDREDWRIRLREIDQYVWDNGPIWRRLARKVARAFANDGAWSVDCFASSGGWVVTDMAQAADSYGCPERLRHPDQPRMLPPVSDQEKDHRAAELLTLGAVAKGAT